MSRVWQQATVRILVFARMVVIKSTKKQSELNRQIEKQAPQQPHRVRQGHSHAYPPPRLTQAVTIFRTASKIVKDRQCANTIVGCSAPGRKWKADHGRRAAVSLGSLAPVDSRSRAQHDEGRGDLRFPASPSNDAQIARAARPLVWGLYNMVGDFLSFQSSWRIPVPRLLASRENRAIVILSARGIRDAIVSEASVVVIAEVVRVGLAGDERGQSAQSIWPRIDAL
ncbi:hypothetical protein MRB53_039247 [Persea americana]|nr:hypothetical protein MRB53_039247 [Persea americana]